MEDCRISIDLFSHSGLCSHCDLFFRISKRITILEEHDKEQIKAVNKIGSLTEQLPRIDTKLDLLLDGKLKGGA